VLVFGVSLAVGIFVAVADAVFITIRNFLVTLPA
jgi:hypothetical protein